MMREVHSALEGDLRQHPRVAYQKLVEDASLCAHVAEQLPDFVPFRDSYHGVICIVDWDHRLPSTSLPLRIYAYYTEEALSAGEEAYAERRSEIERRDVFPEFDVPDFDNLGADEAYEIEVSVDGEVGSCRLTSSWRRKIESTEGSAAVAVVSETTEYQRLLAVVADRAPRLGGLEAVSWTPPCESKHDNWTIDVWYLLAFDGRMGTGRSFLVDLESGTVVASRDFSVRTA